MMPFWKPFSTKAPGSSIDCWTNLASLPFRVLSRLGPIVPLAPASASVWQEPQAGEAVLAKSAFGARGAPPPPPGAPPGRPAPPRRGAAAGRRAAAAPGAQVGEPLVEVGGGDHVSALAHDGVSESAQLGAHHGVCPGLGRLDPDAGGDPGHGVDLLPEGGDPEVVEDVLRLDVEADRLALGEIELARGDLLAAALAGVVEGPGELLADHAVLHLARLGGLHVAQDDVGVGAQRDEDDRRRRGPDHLEPRVAVDRQAVLELLARAHAEPPHA